MPTPEVTMPETRVLPIDQVTPYWRNPRRIPDDAVAKVRESIEKYGYSQPIVVDADNVVIVGHTRLRALHAMGVTEVEVYVSRLPEDKAREYRITDNRLGELSSWDHSQLVLELREWESSLLESFFPHVDLEIATVREATQVTEEEVEEAQRTVSAVREAAPLLLTTVECPSCLAEFSVKTTSLPGLTSGDVADLETAAQD